MPKDFITEFKDEYRFLSNFYPASVRLRGREYPSVEFAFQAAKTLDENQRLSILNCSTPGQAKKMGQTVALRPGWEGMKIRVMEALVRYKFEHHQELAEALLATGVATLIEGNTWGDTFWGAVFGFDNKYRGENHLGRILMRTRVELRGKDQL